MANYKLHNEVMASFEQNSGNKNQLIVQTPYGRGLVINTRCNKLTSNKKRDTIKEIRLLDWEHGSRNSIKKIPMLYTSNEYPSVLVHKGDDVLTPYGRGIVEEMVFVKIRKKRGLEEANSIDEEILLKYRVILISWRLAGRSRVKCYLFPTQVKVVRCKTLGEMDPIERVDFAIKQKQIAGKLFAVKNYSGALNKYAEAVDAVRYIQHAPNNSNECRADLLALIITCSNNAATCCVHLEKFDEAIRFAKNALIMLNALHGKRGMKIHGILLKDHQISDSKLFGEWRGKSCLIIARSEAQKELFEESLDYLRKAKEFISIYIKDETDSQHKRLKEIMKDVVKVKNSTIIKKKAILEKEKAKAKKMFSSNLTTNALAQKQIAQKHVTVQENSNQIKMQISEEQMNGVGKINTNNIQKDNKISHGKKLEGSKEEQEDRVSKRKNVKRVSFSENLEERRILEQEGNDYEEPWYEEHKEALLLLTLGSLAIFTTILGGLRKK